MQVAFAFVVGNNGFFRTIEHQSFAFRSRTNLRDIVETEHHVLRRHGDRCTVCRVQNVMALQHQNLRFQYCLIAQRKVDSHLVTVEVGVKCRTCQRVELDCLAFDEFRLECLNTQTVKCRGTVQENWVSFHHVLQNIPDNRFTAVNDFLGTLHRLHNTALNEFADNERLIKLGCHQLRQTALSHLQFRTYNNDRTS